MHYLNNNFIIVNFIYFTNVSQNFLKDFKQKAGMLVLCWAT